MLSVSIKRSPELDRGQRSFLNNLAKDCGCSKPELSDVYNYLFFVYEIAKPKCL